MADETQDQTAAGTNPDQTDQAASQSISDRVTALENKEAATATAVDQTSELAAVTARLAVAEAWILHYFGVFRHHGLTGPSFPAPPAAVPAVTPIEAPTNTQS